MLIRLEKWSYFWNLINFQFWPFCHFIDLQLLITTEMLSLSIEFQVALLSHVIGVKHDFNVVIWPYFQSTPNYVQCGLSSKIWKRPTMVTPCSKLGQTLYQTLSHLVTDPATPCTRPYHVLYQALSYLVPVHREHVNSHTMIA